MRPNQRGYGVRRGWWPPGPALVTGVVLLVALGALWGTGILRPETFGWGEKKAPSRAGLIPVPTSAGPIPAYTKLTRDHLWNPKVGEFAMIYLPPASVSPEMIQDLGKIVGRVMDHDKPAGYVFTEADFLPKGTRPGLVAGIPPGKRAIRVDSEKVYGLQGLQRGDRFDLVSTIALDSKGGNSAGGLGGGIYAQQMELQAKLNNWQKQATVSVVVLNGVVVDPVGTRVIPTTSNSLTQGSVTRTKPVQEVVIAIDPSEVARLTEAMAVDARIVCVPRSGRPEEEPSIAPAPSRPRSPYAGEGGQGPMTTIETINGTKRDLVATPGQK
ncbi:MAG: hypothetical protein SGI92_17855 [Bryobacteraceae bacterium]|nr:hypothetical protein [Bryobacteraceae bacterium]